MTYRLLFSRRAEKEFLKLPIAVELYKYNFFIDISGLST